MMWANLLIGAIIFGYAGWTLYKHVKKSKEGFCATCSLKEQCTKCVVGQRLGKSEEERLQ